VAPNLTGAGVKFKVLDAMSHGLPVVATPIAAEGIVEGAPEGVFAAITADPRQLGERIAALLADPAHGRAIGRRAQAWVRERYDFDRSMAAVLGVYADLTGRG
jgi:glycosyltransferase involved in cell wall biosynthesis